MEKKKHPSSWVRHKHCIFLPSSVNKTTESTGKPRSKHFSTQLNLGLERLRLREQHNPNKKPPCITPERQDLDSSVDPQNYQEVEAQPGRKHPHHAKAKLLSQLPHHCCQREADMGETEGHMMHEVLSSDSLEAMWGDLVWMGIHNGSIHLAQSLCGSLAILIGFPSLVKWWLLRGNERQ